MSIPGENFEELSDFQKEALKELGTMGAGQAASALTEFLEQPIIMKVPSVRMVSLESIPDLLKARFPADTQIAISSASNMIEIFYTVLVLFDKETVTEILSQKSPPADNIEILMEFSTVFMDLIREIGSIILIRYILTLNTFLCINATVPSQPNLRIGNPDSLQQYELAGLTKKSNVIFIECDLSSDRSRVKAECILIPHNVTYDRFFGMLLTQNF